MENMQRTFDRVALLLPVVRSQPSLYDTVMMTLFRDSSHIHHMYVSAANSTFLIHRSFVQRGLAGKHMLLGR